MLENHPHHEVVKKRFFSELPGKIKKHFEGILSIEPDMGRRRFLKISAIAGTALIVGEIINVADKITRQGIDYLSLGEIPVNKEILWQNIPPEILEEMKEVFSLHAQTKLLLNQVKSAYSVQSDLQLSNISIFTEGLLDHFNRNDQSLDINLRGGRILHKDSRELIEGISPERKAVLDQELPIFGVEADNRLGTAPDAENLVMGMFKSYVQREPGRIKKITIGNNFQTDPALGTVQGGFGDQSGMFLALPAFFHELKHGTDPLLESFYLNTQNTLESSGYRLQDSVKIYNEWLALLLSEQDFFKKYFISSGVKGDGTQPDPTLRELLNKGNITRVLSEIIAISTSNYIFGIQHDWPTEKELDAFPEIKKVINKQIAVTVLGAQGFEAKADGAYEEDVTALRRRVRDTYISYILGHVSDTTKVEITRALEMDLSSFYKVNESDPDPNDYFFYFKDTLGETIIWPENDKTMVHVFADFIKYFGKVFLV